MTEAADDDRFVSLEKRCDDLRARLVKMDAKIGVLRRDQRIAFSCAAAAIVASFVFGLVAVRAKSRLKAKELALVDDAGRVYAGIRHDDAGAKFWIDGAEKGPSVTLAAAATNGDAYVTAKSGDGKVTMYTSAGRLNLASFDARFADAWASSKVDAHGGKTATLWAHTDLFDAKLEAGEGPAIDEHTELSLTGPNGAKKTIPLMDEAK